MLSHMLGRTGHSTAARASERQVRAADLEANLTRQTERQRQALATSDDRIGFLNTASNGLERCVQDRAGDDDTAAITDIELAVALGIYWR